MTKYRTFRDHMGRIHKVPVRMTRQEIREKRLYWIGFYAICIAFGMTLGLVSGILW